jgi:hypothetical protein
MLKPPRSPRLTAVELYSLSFELNSLPALSLELSAFIPFHLQLLSLTPAYAQDAKFAKKRQFLKKTLWKRLIDWNDDSPRV